MRDPHCAALPLPKQDLQAPATEQAWQQEVMGCGLALAILSSICRLKEFACSEDMAGRVPVLIKASKPSTDTDHRASEGIILCSLSIPHMNHHHPPIVFGMQVVKAGGVPHLIQKSINPSAPGPGSASTEPQAPAGASASDALECLVSIAGCGEPLACDVVLSHVGQKPEDSCREIFLIPFEKQGDAGGLSSSSSSAVVKDAS
jgi:hypothetical protein